MPEPMPPNGASHGLAAIASPTVMRGAFEDRFGSGTLASSTNCSPTSSAPSGRYKDGLVPPLELGHIPDQRRSLDPGSRRRSVAGGNPNADEDSRLLESARQTFVGPAPTLQPPYMDPLDGGLTAEQAEKLKRDMMNTVEIGRQLMVRLSTLTEENDDLREEVEELRNARRSPSAVVVSDEDPQLVVSLRDTRRENRVLQVQYDQAVEENQSLQARVQSLSEELDQLQESFERLQQQRRPSVTDCSAAFQTPRDAWVSGGMVPPRKLGRCSNSSGDSSPDSHAKRNMKNGSDPMRRPPLVPSQTASAGGSSLRRTPAPRPCRRAEWLGTPTSVRSSEASVRVWQPPPPPTAATPEPSATVPLPVSEFLAETVLSSQPSPPPPRRRVVSEQGTGEVQSRSGGQVWVKLDVGGIEAFDEAGVKYLDPAPAGSSATVIASRKTLRTFPAHKGEFVAQGGVARGSAVTVHATTEGWALVETANQAVGWLKSPHIKYADCESTACSGSSAGAVDGAALRMLMDDEQVARSIMADEEDFRRQRCRESCASERQQIRRDSASGGRGGRSQAPPARPKELSSPKLSCATDESSVDDSTSLSHLLLLAATAAMGRQGSIDSGSEDSAAPPLAKELRLRADAVSSLPYLERLLPSRYRHAERRNSIIAGSFRALEQGECASRQMVESSAAAAEEALFVCLRQQVSVPRAREEEVSFVLLKRSDYLHKWRARLCVLRVDEMRIDFFEGAFPHQRHRLRGTVALPDISAVLAVVPGVSEPSYQVPCPSAQEVDRLVFDGVVERGLWTQCGFTLRLRRRPYQYHFACPSPAECRRWLEGITSHLGVPCQTEFPDGASPLRRREERHARGNSVFHP
eukprot:TRINITY_DN3639_c1_g1_i1.p1 TRINITY_DN3639_c1_g1~~TRINITY_DN3639_c1_g1_i1.p1  ORF type:complete len:862 (+),score=254.94 TRINITY_DN3639_c1_g1_i1:89-2674(+)